jgi:hypothetical protein
LVTQFKAEENRATFGASAACAAKENSGDKIPTAKKAAGRFNEWAVMGLSLAKSR